MGREERMTAAPPAGRVRGHLVYLAAFFMDFSMGCGSVAGVYCAKEKFGATPAQLGLYASLSAGIYVCSALLFGRLSDRWGRRTNIVLACAAAAAALTGAPLAGTLWQLYGLMMASACGHGAFWPAIEADISDHSTPDELSRRLGRFNVAWGMGLVTGSLVAGWMGQHRGWPGVFRMAAGVAIIAMVLHAFRRFAPERALARETAEPPVPGAAALAPSLWKMALLINFAAVGLAGTVRVHMPTVSGGGRGALGGTYLALLYLAQFVSFLVLARWQGWRHRLAPLTGASLLAVAGAAVCGLFSGSYLFGAGCLLAGFGCGVAYNLSLYYSVAAASGRGHRGGIHEAVLASGAAVIPYAGGLLATTSLAKGFPWSKGVPHLTAGVLLLVAFLCARWCCARSRGRKEP
jgi:predicted MFS family arabinose efflux permease